MFVSWLRFLSLTVVSAWLAAGCSSGESLMPGFIVDDHGYVTAGPWHGWAWTETEEPNLGTTIAPMPPDKGGAGFFATNAGSPLCVSGTVAQDPNYAGIAVLGINIQQDKTPWGAPLNTWTPTGSGVNWQVANTGGSPLRIAIQGPAGYPSQSWCYPITGSSGSIKWLDFASQCWVGGNGTNYDESVPLNQIIVEVPGLNTAAEPFNFCLEGVAPY